MPNRDRRQGAPSGGLYCSFMRSRIHSLQASEVHKDATLQVLGCHRHLGGVGGTGSTRWIGTGIFVALSRFTIANDKADEVRSAFLQRPHLVDTAQGFLGMDVMFPIDSAAEIWLVTRWCDEESYQNWHKSHEYHESHKGIPKGLKLVPGTALVRLFRAFAT